MDDALTSAELRAIVYTVLGEAAGEGNSGMAAVMHVIQNRAADPRFPDNLADVATQSNSKGIHQFSAWNTKALGGNSPVERYPVTSPTFRRAELVVKQVMAGGVPDYTYGATQYWSPNGMGGNEPYWAASEETPHGRVKIGGHVFLARKAVVPIAPRDPAGIAGAVSEKAYLARYAALPSVSPPVVRVNPPMPKPRPNNAVVALNNATKRLPDLSRTTMDLGAAPKASELKAWQSPPPATLKPRTVVAGFSVGAPKSDLQAAVDRKAAQMAAARVPPVTNGATAGQGVATQREEQEAQRRSVSLQQAVKREAGRIALQRATDAKAASMAPAKAVEIAVKAIAATPKTPSNLTNVERQRREQEATRAAPMVRAPAAPKVVATPPSNGLSASANVKAAASDKAVERIGQNLQVEVNRVAAEMATGRKVAAVVAPPGGSASDRARAAQSPKQAAIPGAAVIKATPVAPPTYTVPKYGPNNPTVKGEERLQPDVVTRSPMNGIGKMPAFGDLSALRSKVAPTPPVVAVRRVAPAPARETEMVAAQRRKQAAAAQAVVAQRARQVAVAPAARTAAVAQQSRQYYEERVAAGEWAVSQSGDTSVGNQLEAAQVRASAAAWRESQSRK